jgi:hypothetical protein
MSKRIRDLKRRPKTGVRRVIYSRGAEIAITTDPYRKNKKGLRERIPGIREVAR